MKLPHPSPLLQSRGDKDLTYNIIVIGCQMNKSDSERIAGYLDNLGFQEVDHYGSADLVIITSCGVRQSAEDRIYGFAAGIRKENKKAKILLTGCLSSEKIVRERLKKFVSIWLPIIELPELEGKLREVGLIGNEDKPHPNPLLPRRGGYKDSNYLSLLPKYKSNFSAMVPIGNGCDNFCTYCYVPYARGRETYRPAEEIIAEVKDLVARGYKEITLIAQNVNSYKSIKSLKSVKSKADEIVGFADLLKMVNDIPGDFWLRFATNHPKDMDDDLIETIAACEKACHHIHLPAQAGDDEVLRRMNRKYTHKHYLELINKIRESLNSKINPPQPLPRGEYTPQPSDGHRREFKIFNAPASITTDIIVGFPGETEEQFQRTADLFEEVKFDMAYIGQYSPRHRTIAAKMTDDVSREEKKRREEVLMDILRRTVLENNQAYLHEVVEILVEGKGRQGDLIGRTKTNKVVKVLKDNSDLSGVKKGEFALVKITEIDSFGLKGELV